MSELTLQRPDAINTKPLVVKAYKLALLWMRNYRTRRQLRLLSSEMLADIGVSSTQARKECEKHFWQ